MKTKLTEPPAARRAPFALVAALLLGSSIAAPAETTLFSHTFDGGSGALNGTPVDVGAGNWIAAHVVTAGGTFTTGAGSATLPLVPVHGEIYTLDARVTGVTGNSNWVALGFANGRSSGATTSDRFISGNVVGTAWMLFRGDHGANANSAFLGAGSGTNGGTTDGLAWAAFNTQDGTPPLSPASGPANRSFNGLHPNPLFPRLRSGQPLFQRPSPQKQIPSSYDHVEKNIDACRVRACSGFHRNRGNGSYAKPERIGPCSKRRGIARSQRPEQDGNLDQFCGN